MCVAIRQAGEEVVPRTETFGPIQLPEHDLLVRIIGHGTIPRTLLVPVGAHLEHHGARHGQLVLTDQLPPPGGDALTVDAVATSEGGRPRHLPTPAVLVHITTGEVSHPAVAALHRYLVENGDPLLQRDVSEAITVAVARIIVVEHVQPEQVIHLAMAETGAEVQRMFLPAGGHGLHRQARGQHRVLGDHVDDAPHGLAAVER